MRHRELKDFSIERGWAYLGCIARKNNFHRRADLCRKYARDQGAFSLLESGETLSQEANVAYKDKMLFGGALYVGKEERITGSKGDSLKVGIMIII